MKNAQREGGVVEEYNKKYQQKTEKDERTRSIYYILTICKAGSHPSIITELDPQ